MTTSFQCVEKEFHVVTFVGWLLMIHAHNNAPRILKPRKVFLSIVFYSYGVHFCFIYKCRVEIEAEIRKQVDELMREELKNLKLVRLSRYVFLSVT